MDKIFSVLRFFRVVDESNNLSLTNLAMAGSFIAMLLRPELTAVDVGTFVASLVSYQAKRWIGGGATPEQDTAAIEAAVKSLETKVTALQLGQQIQKR